MKGKELVHKLMCLMSGHRPWQEADTAVDAIFVFGRADREWEMTPGNEGILQTAADLFQKKVAPRIVIPGYLGNPDGRGGVILTAYPGWKIWVRALMGHQVPRKNIFTTEGQEGTNTKTEGNDFVLAALHHKWTSAVVVTHPHQMLRAMLGLVRTMEQMDYWLNILPICPSQINWADPVFGSQGEKCLLRHQHIDEEWERIPRYQEQGDLVTFEELEVYLRNVLGC